MRGRAPITTSDKCVAGDGAVLYNFIFLRHQAQDWPRESDLAVSDAQQMICRPLCMLFATRSLAAPSRFACSDHLPLRVSRPVQYLEI
jgi:hypothetical protein